MKKFNSYLQSLTVAKRMAIFAFLSIGSILYVGLTTFPELQKLAELNQQFYEYPHTTTNTVRDMKFTLLMMRRVTRDAIFETDSDKRVTEIASLEAYHSQFFDSVKIIRKSFLGDQQLIGDAESQYRNMIAYTNESLAILKAGHQDEAWKRSIDSTPGNPGPLLAAKLDEIHKKSAEFAAKLNQEAKDTYQNQVRAAIYDLGFGLVLLLSSVFVLTRSITRPLGSLRDSIVDLSQGKMHETIPYQDQQNEIGEIGRGMAVLQDVYLKLESQRWVKEQLSEIAQSLQTASTRAEFGDLLCSHLAQNMGLAYGALFVADADRTELKRFGGYGCDDSIHANRFAWGQSLVGQVALSKNQILMSPAEGDRVGVSTGLGKLLIRNVLIAPIMDRDSVLAVLELGTLQTFDNRQMLFLEALLPDIAEKIQILAGNVATRELLDQTQAQAQALAVSEQQLLSRRAELEENNNKLAEQARALEESAEELEQQKSSLLGQREELEASKESLAQTEERTRLILSAVSDGIVGMDSEGNLTFCNSAASSMLGYAEDELIGKALHSLVHYAYPDGREFPRAECPMYLTSRDGELRKVDSEVLWRKDGTALPVAYIATAIYQGGRITGSVIVFRDITEQKQAEEERLQASSLPNVAKRR